MGILGDNKEKESKPGFFCRLFEKFLGGDNNGSSNPNAMKLKDLEKIVMNIFEDRMDVLTTDESLLFPAKFEIYMHPVDFDNLAGAYGNASRDLAKKFCRRLKAKYEEIKKENPEFEFISHTSRWYFQFVPITDAVSDGEKVKEKQEVPQGTVFAITEVFPPLHENESNKESERVRVQTINVKPVQTMTDIKGSRIVKYEVNREFYKNLIKLDENTFEIPFEGIDIPVNGGSKGDKGGKEKENGKILAKLEWDGSCAEITNKDFKISGRADKSMDGGIPVLSLNNDNIQSPHVHIRYDESANEFKIMAFAETKVNGINMPIKEWRNLPKKNAKVLMGSGFNVVQMKFDGLV